MPDSSPVAAMHRSCLSGFSTYKFGALLRVGEASPERYEPYRAAGLPGHWLKGRVISQSHRVAGLLNHKQPLAVGIAIDPLIQGNRILIG